MLSSRFGVNDHVYEWFHSYLSGRTQIFSTLADTSNAVALICSVPQSLVVGPILCITYTEDVEDLIQTFSVKDHIYADDTQLLAYMRLTEVLRYRRNIERCVGQIQDWCTSKRLELNPDKTERIWLGSKANLAQLKADELYLHLGSVDIKPSNMVRDLGVWLNSELTMHDHISRTVSSCFSHLRRLRQLRGVVCRSTMQRLVSALVLSRFDYWNAALFGLPSTTLDPLRRVHNAADRPVAGFDPRNNVTEQMKKLHWLSIKYRINFTFSDDARRCDFSMPAIHSGHCPSSVNITWTEWASSSCEWPVRHPHDKNCFRWKSFLRAGPRKWNTLPQNITAITNREALKRALKTLF